MLRAWFAWQKIGILVAADFATVSLDREFRFLAFDSRMPIAGSFAPRCVLGLPGKISEFRPLPALQQP
jgi:hypothetical protein